MLLKVNFQGQELCMEQLGKYSTEKPLLIFITGASGAGKTTEVGGIVIQSLEIAETIDKILYD